MSLKCADQRTSIQLDHNTHLKTVQTPTTYEPFFPPADVYVETESTCKSHYTQKSRLWKVEAGGL